MSEQMRLDQDIANHLRQERRRMEEEHHRWLGQTLNSVYAYQWRCVATGGNAVNVTWRFKPWPSMVRKRVHLKVVRQLLRHWTSGGRWGSMPSRTNRATLYRRYGPFLKIVKPKYWSDCHGCEPTLFSQDKEWSLDSWLEHRRRDMSDWTQEDEDRERASWATQTRDKA